MAIFERLIRYDRKETAQLFKDYPSTSLKNRRKLRVFRISHSNGRDALAVAFGWREVAAIFYTQLIQRLRGGAL